MDYELVQCKRWNVARAGGGRDCIPRDCLTVTVATASRGSSQPLPRLEAFTAQRTSFLPREGGAHPEEPSSSKSTGSQTGRCGGGKRVDDGGDCSTDRP